MDQNQRPHSRKKTVGSGSAGAHSGGSAGGNGPVGSGGRKTSSSGQRASSSASLLGPLLSLLLGGKGKKKLNLKTILILALVVIAIFFVMKKFSGGSLLQNADFSQGINPFNSSSTVSDLETDYSKYSAPDYTVSKLARAKRVTPVGNGNDTVTIMVYMCGTDLESKYGMATKDLQEMLKAKISSKVNLIVETGGCKKWQNSTVSSSKNQIYKVESGGLRKLVDNNGTSSMTDPKNLTSFINYCQKNYPADRNMLIFWDHGGGSLTGYGYDEKNPNSSSMTLDKINSALKASKCTFDFIGFDACLMATLETALVCNSYADYLIGSEESEPGTGWYYTNWLTEISNNTSVATLDIAQTIIDDFVASCGSSSPTGVTLSVIDLAEMQGTVPDTFKNFSTSTTELVKSDDYKVVSNARAGVRQFAAQSKINQVDLIDLAQRIGTEESKALADALHGCVKYNKATMTHSNGVSIYFPYESTKNVKAAVASYEALGIDSEYSKCIKSFASLEYGGQIAASASQLPTGSMGSIGTELLGTLINSYTGTTASTSPLGSLLGTFVGGATGSSGGSTISLPAAGNSIDLGTLTSLLGAFSGRSMPAEYDWVDTELIADKAEDIAKDYLDPSRITATDKNGTKVLSLTDNEWALVQTAELNVFAKDGNGYIDLGLDNTFDWDEDNDMILGFDGTWLTLNGNVCAYYLVSDTQNADESWTTVGRIPARLNGDFVNLRVVFDDAHPDGIITGAYPLYEDAAIGVQAKGNIEVKAGDKIELLCDYYSLDGDYSDTHTLGDSFTVPESGLKLENLKLTNKEVTYTYRITDIYGNHFWTPVVG